MLTNEDIICFSSIDWDFNWQGHQEIMHRFAAAGNRVLFIENTGVRSPRLRDYDRLLQRLRNWWKGYKGFRLQEPNLYVFSPLLLPFPYSRLARWINKRLILRLLNSWCRVQQFSSPIILSFLPSGLTLEVIKSLPRKIIIYYCIDSFQHSSPGAARIAESERQMLRRADLVFVTSELLREYCREYNEEIHKFPFTVDFEPFAAVRESPLESLPEDLKNVPAPRIGYIGGLHRWLDQELVAELAALLPEASFVFVGPEQEPTGTLRSAGNVYLLGGKPHGELPLYLKHFALGLIPYRKTDYTDNVYPTKLNEYLAMGLPVASTPIREVVHFGRENPGMVDLAPDAAGLREVIVKRLEEAGSPGSEALRQKRIETARLNSWSVRIEEMSLLIRSKADELKNRAQVRWRERLSDIFVGYRKKALTVLAVILLAYWVFFRTPLIYFIGRPLAVSDWPVRSQVILVFGGGLGETGRPGRSTFERARLAADLYRQGLADRIIFSSGFQQYSDRDAEDMRKLALSEGVPEEAILIDDRAANNYENVVNCLDLMKDHGFASALVVSGRYNMLRTRLIFEHQIEGQAATGIAPDSLRLVPVTQSIFFDPGEGDRLRQLEAILHEYEAILYYWWKGRI